jgi:hypothetical protein
MEHHTAKHFVLQLGSLISLYLSLSFFIVLVFSSVNLLFPDAIDGFWEVEQAASSIRLGFAMVLVFFPTYLVLMRQVNKNRRHNKSNSYLGLTKWLIYLTLLISGLVLLGDLVAVIMSFLEGELTTRFILKAATVFLVIGGAFSYYILDAKGYWLKNEKQSIIYGATTAIVIAAAMVVALTQIPNPSQVREMKMDNEMVGDLQDMQWRIEDYYRTNDSLPADLQTLYGEFAVPETPADKPDYEYSVMEEEAYKLCATFTHDSTGVSTEYTRDRIVPGPNFPGNYNWDYKAGYWCFDRKVDDEYRK